MEEDGNAVRRLVGVWGSNAPPRESEEEEALRAALTRASPEN